MSKSVHAAEFALIDNADSLNNVFSLTDLVLVRNVHAATLGGLQ